MPARVGLLQAVLDTTREGMLIFRGQELYAANPRARVLLQQDAPQTTVEPSEAILPDTTPPEPSATPAAILQLVNDVILSGLPIERHLEGLQLRAKGTAYIEANGEAFVILTVEEASSQPGPRMWNALADKRQWANIFADHWHVAFMCCEWDDDSKDFTYHAVNDAAVKALGAKQQSDIVGKTTTQLVRYPLLYFADRNLQGWPKSETSRWAEIIGSIPEGVSTAVDIPTGDGSRVFRNTGIRCPKATNPKSFRFFHSLEDLTNLRRAEKALEEEQAKLRETVDELQMLKLLFDTAPLGMGLLELSADKSDVRFFSVNPVVDRILSAGTPTGKAPTGWMLNSCTKTESTNNFFHEGVVKCLEFAKCCDVEFQCVNATAVSAEIEYWWWKCYFVPLGNGRVGYMAREITHQKKLEAMLRKQGEDLEKAVQERTRDLEAALQVKNRFLAVVSHEIRTPIAGVLGSMELLSETELSEDQIPLLRTARTCGEQLSTVINDILDLTKIQERRIEITNEELCFRELLEDLMDITVFSIGRRKIELILDYDEAVPEWVVGDIVRLRQILMNILSNAVKFTDEGEVVVEVTTDAPSQEQLQSGQRTVLVHVRDTGIGIPAEVHSKIFQPFSQADSSVNRRFGGSGLGLSISKNLAQLMGGDLTFVSDPAATPGTTFTLRFTSAAVFAPILPLPFRPRVVVVEPSASLTRVLSKRLGALGCEVVTFTSLATCLPLLQGAAPAAASPSASLVDSPVIVGKRKADTQSPPAAAPRIAPEQPILLLLDTSTDVQSVSEVQNAMPWLKVVFMGYNSAQLSAPFLNKPMRRASLRAAVISATDYVDPRQPGKAMRKCGAEKHELKILVAEDNPSNQLIIRKYLELLGYSDVKVVENGRQALSEALTVRYDVVLMDLMMPIMSGLEASEQIHASLPPDERPYVVALTASTFEEDKQKCLQAGMQAVLTKPLNRSQLEQLLNRRLMERKAA